MVRCVTLFCLRLSLHEFASSSLFRGTSFATSLKSHLPYASQAVILPSAMPSVMEETQLRKARLLGGKLGKKVQSLLPENETTMGSISRLMSLDQLEKEIGKESGRWVFDACRGIDYEEVKATLKVLPKSITVSLVRMMWNTANRIEIVTEHCFDHSNIYL